ncbi:hypothetical protein BVX94_02825, partial [bacterium B17]
MTSIVRIFYFLKDLCESWTYLSDRAKRLILTVIAIIVLVGLAISARGDEIMAATSKTPSLSLDDHPTEETSKPM